MTAVQQPRMGTRVRGIASKLTAAQVAALVGVADRTDIFVDHSGVRRALYERGLIETAPRGMGCVLTALGQAVLAFLHERRADG